MTDNLVQFPINLRPIRPAPDPLGLYLRASRNDHKELSNLIASGDGSFFGIVFDPTLINRHKELLEQAIKHNYDAILDPKTQQSSFLGGYNDKLGALPWGVSRPHNHSDFQGNAGRQLVSKLGDFALKNGFTQVMAPTHLLKSIEDPWLPLDIDAFHYLKNYLVKNGGSFISVIYPLVISYSAFRDRNQRRLLIEKLRTVPIPAIWIRVEGFGSGSTATSVGNYLEATTDFHSLGIPIIADQVGGLVGLSLLAFGAVGGIAHGITLGEKFDSRHWKTPREGGGFGQPHRVYIPEIGLILKESQARVILESSQRARNTFGCKDTMCCPRGVKDMLERKGRHYLYQRIKEISGLSQIPDQLKPQRYLDQFLRPATYQALAASNINFSDESMSKKIREHRKYLDSLLVALGTLAVNNPPRSFSTLPKSRSARESRNSVNFNR